MLSIVCQMEKKCKYKHITQIYIRLLFFSVGVITKINVKCDALG